MGNDSSRVPLPHKNDHMQIEAWIEQQIWGHRLWDTQSSWLLFLEFLNIAEACQRENKLLEEGGIYYPLNFKPYKRMYLRNIIFNNESIHQISDQYSDSETAWREWLEWMEENAKAVHSRDFSYLKKRFHSFNDFASLVGMLQCSAVESNTNRRWSSRFVFPFGLNALYEDLNIQPNGSASREYINFTRTGELLYLMLCRSEAANELVPHISNIIEGKNQWNSLLSLMQPENENDLSVRGKSYLPYKSHELFDKLGNDWLNVLKLGLHGFDAYPYLVVLGAFYVLLYQLEIAAEWCNEADHYMVCEVIAPRKTLVRQLSIESYQRNSLLSRRAVETFIKRIHESDEWKDATNKPGAFENCRQIIEQKVRWPRKPSDYEGCNDPESLIKELYAISDRRHKDHPGNIHRAYGGDIGLVSKRATNRLRYAPSDRFLKSLVLSNVEDRMEYNEFLSLLYDRYGLIFGDRQAALVLADDRFEPKAFQANSKRLEQRLSSLGMLRRLSDACAYVHNPLSRS